MDAGGAVQAEFARDVRVGLCNAGRKRLPAKYLYDMVGAALFEAITHLPEYGLTRADERILQRCAPSLPRHFPSTDVIVAELGSGSGSKTRPVLTAFPPGRIRFYAPIDISLESVDRCRHALGDLVQVRAHHGGYLDGVRELRVTRPPGVPLLLLFLGSSIGNLDRNERDVFLAEIRSQLLPGDSVLLGFDLVKSKAKLLKAYDDPTGVSAAFNRNVLGRVNRELGSDFDLASFDHVARYDELNQRIEMHLLSRSDQQVPIPGAGGTCNLRQGETVWTESSYKFQTKQVRETMESAGFLRLTEWVDSEWPFLEGLWTVHD